MVLIEILTRSYLGEDNIITCHDRYARKFGKGFLSVISAVLSIAKKYQDVPIYIPVHPNPNVYVYIQQKLGDLDNVILLRPVKYEKFVILMKITNRGISTDCGGIQEGAPSLGIPILIMRDNTERPEGVKAGVFYLIRTKAEMIENLLRLHYLNKKYNNNRSKTSNPYGDGTAALKIKKILLEIFNVT